MNKDKKFLRRDILPLNLKDIKDLIRPEKKTKLVVSEDGFDIPNSDFKSWVLSTPCNISISRKEIGKTLLRKNRSGFLLHDPYMHESRFFVEYHRLQDPALRRYFNSVPISQRMKKLGIVTKRKFAICSTKEFADYVRYLNEMRTLEVADKLTSTVDERLSKHMLSWEAAKEYESQFTGIFRRKKFRNERKPRVDLIEERKAISSKISRLNLIHIERAELVKKTKGEYCKQINQEKEEKFNENKQMILQQEQKKKIETKKKLENKIEQAEQRKKDLGSEKIIVRSVKELDFFKNHWKIREDARERNILLFRMYEAEKHQNILRRENELQQIRERNEMKKIILRSKLDQRIQFKEIVRKVANKSQIQAEKYLKIVDPKDYAEISRRFAMLTEPFISDCLQRVNKTLHDLKIHVSAATLVHILLSFMNLPVVIIPEIGPSKCALVRKRVAEFMVNIITQIKIERLKNIRDNPKRKEKNIVSDDSTLSLESKSRHVSVDETAAIIGESSFSFDEFMGDLKCTPARKTEKTYNLTELIDIGVKSFFETISKKDLQFSDKLNGRDFIHLYDFQKYSIFKSMKRFIELVRVKQRHYWNENRNISTWQKMNLNLEELSIEAMNTIMVFSQKDKDKNVSGCVRKIAKYICVQISQQQDHPNEHNDEPKDDGTIESEFDLEN